MSRKYGLPVRCAFTDCAAAVLDAAVTAEMIKSALRTASAADCATPTPIAPAACLSFAPSGFGNRMSQAVMVSRPASRKPEAMAWPASPKPINAIVGLPFGILLFLRCDDLRR